MRGLLEVNRVGSVVVRGEDLEACEECAEVGGGEEEEKGADDSEGEGEKGLVACCERGE